MNDYNRRLFLKGILARLVQAAGTVVVASAAASTAKAQGDQSGGDGTPPEGLQERADRLAATAQASAEGAESGALAFLNGAFRNTPIGGFGNGPFGGFRNTPLGNFRN